VIWRWAIRVGLLIPVAALAALAIPRLNTGLLLEEAFPATTYIETNTPLPAASYQQVARVLSGASHSDSETALVQAEAAINAGAVPATIIPKVELALGQSPFLARGWIILASLWTDADRPKAVKAFALAVDLAPREYYLMLPEMLVGAPLWGDLSAGVRARLLSDVDGLAVDQDRRGQLRLLLTRQAGADLMVRGFSGHPEALRGLNRDLARERLGLSF
jgi:hypothetical protein